MPLYWENLTALFQKSLAAGEQPLPQLTFDARHFLDGRRAGSIIATAAHPWAANFVAQVFTAPREGIYLVDARFASFSGAVHHVEFHHDDGAQTLWSVSGVSVSAGVHFKEILYLLRNHRLLWVIRTASAVGDSVLMNITNWEVVQA